MHNDSTTSKLNILNSVNINDIDDYLSEHISDITIGDYFSQCINHNIIKPADIVRKCQGYISKSYIYALINGEKSNPSRDVVILICLAGNMNLKQTRRTLELFHHRPLYPKDSRDAIIAICINNETFDIAAVNDCLFEHGLETLGQMKS